MGAIIEKKKNFPFTSDKDLGGIDQVLLSLFLRESRLLSLLSILHEHGHTSPLGGAVYTTTSAFSAIVGIDGTECYL